MEEDITKSTFNEASFKMSRIHELQQTCNNARLKPFICDVSKDAMYFRIHYQALISLWHEISSKCSSDEKEKLKPIRIETGKEVKNLLSKYKPGALNPYINPGKENEELKEKVEEALFDLEEEIRFLIDEHGFSTMNMESTDGDVYN